MVLATQCETVSILPSEFADLFDVGAPDFDQLPLDSLDGINWLTSPSHDDILNELSRPLTPANHEFKDGFPALWKDSVFSSHFEAAFSEFDSSSSSPVDGMLNFSSGSECEEVLFEPNHSSKPAKRKASHYDDDEDDESDDDEFEPAATIKKMKANVKAGKQSKVRRINDDATNKMLAVIRSQHHETPDSRRYIHNVLERKRRNDLKDSYQELREAMPELESNDRTPTGQILQKAVEYIELLQAGEKALEVSRAAARGENERLRKVLGMK